MAFWYASLVVYSDLTGLSIDKVLIYPFMGKDLLAIAKKGEIHASSTPVSDRIEIRITDATCKGAAVLGVYYEQNW
jgi:hypothetical protein